MKRRTKWFLSVGTVLVIGGLVVVSIVWKLERSLWSRYERVEVGMAYDDVVDLLGPPAASYSGVVLLDTWERDGVFVCVECNVSDGRVIEKNIHQFRRPPPDWLLRLQDLWKRFGR